MGGWATSSGASGSYESSPLIVRGWVGVGVLTPPGAPCWPRVLFKAQPMLCREGGEDDDVLGGCQCPGLLLDHFGELGVGAGVEGDDAVAVGAFEDRVQHGVVLPDAGGREAVLVPVVT